jgi:hypothetical protein
LNKLTEIFQSWVAAANPSKAQKLLAEARTSVCDSCPNKKQLDVLNEVSKQKGADLTLKEAQTYYKSKGVVLSDSFFTSLFEGASLDSVVKDSMEKLLNGMVGNNLKSFTVYSTQLQKDLEELPKLQAIRAGLQSPNTGNAVVDAILKANIKKADATLK